MDRYLYILWSLKLQDNTKEAHINKPDNGGQLEHAIDSDPNNGGGTQTTFDDLLQALQQLEADDQLPGSEPNSREDGLSQQQKSRNLAWR